MLEVINALFVALGQGAIAIHLIGPRLIAEGARTVEIWPTLIVCFECY